MTGIDVLVDDGATLEAVATVGTEGVPVDSMQCRLLVQDMNSILTSFCFKFQSSNLAVVT